MESDEIDRKIAEVVSHISALRSELAELRQLKSVAWVKVYMRTNDRLTSRNKAKFELLGRIGSLIAGPLNPEKEPMDTGRLYAALQDQFDIDMNYTTFRSHLHRFSAKDMRMEKDAAGRWRMLDDPKVRLRVSKARPP